MIPSYQEEIRIHKSKDRIFWTIVFIMTAFLYFFFQGIYPDYNQFIKFFSHQETPITKQTFLKHFGMMEIKTTPSPDEIWINNEQYSNNLKKMMDFGEYKAFIKKEGYISITFPFQINQEHQVYINTVNLLALPKFLQTTIHFSNLSTYDNFFLLHITETGSFMVVDKDFQALQGIRTDYKYIGGDYFSDGSHLYNYSLDTEKFLPIIDHTTKLPIICTNISYYGEKLFCHDTMQFVGPNISDIREKILAINNNIIVTPRYIYNNTTNTSWKYFAYQTGTIVSPENIVYIEKIPYVLEKGKLSLVAPSLITPTTPVKKLEWGIDIISQAQEFGDETILLGEKGGKGKFRIIDTEKQYSGVFDFEHTDNVKVSKVNGVYIFITPKSAYVYYKGAQEIVKILNDVNIINLVDGKIFFSKEGENYVVDLLRKEVK